MDFNTDVLWSALGLMLVFEGVFPFVSPRGWRDKMVQIMSLQDGQIRFFGLLCLLAGLLLLGVFG